MDAYANGLARSLLSRGTQRGEVVGIYMEKSVEMFISILGIYKAGAVFVPLDPEHPAERIRTILDSAGTTSVLVNRSLQTQFDDAVLGCGVLSHVIDVSSLSPSSKPDVGHISRSDVSHILFTSGSTGTPKGTLPTSCTRSFS